ncbi:MAG TPA: AmmeMemoRadiSam system protein B [Candidatus Acidoferrales bacterium]|nr:AmmeMemoRadiSam system protein B [Candidatus Acidoferrales bacterium]
MSLTPDDPPARPRIILPGAESEPVEKPRIILPPGAVRESADDLPEYPRLRRLMMLPVRDGGRELLLVQDPMGIMPGQPVLGIESLAILQLLDGTIALKDISAAVMQESKDLRVGNMVRDFIAQLDELLMLESPRFEHALDEARRAYHALEIRPAALEGVSFPADPAELERFLDAHFAEAEAARAAEGAAPVAADAVPRALLAPHLDPRREGTLMARAFLELGPEPKTPLRVVIFGTGHNLVGDFHALTRKHFQTPLGKALCDTAFVDRVAAKLGDAAYRGELAHRDEHSIEFQVLYLQRRLRGRPFTIVPILCGGFYHLLDEGRTPREEPGIEALIEAIREAEQALGGVTLHVAGVDFSHVGPRFGDGRVTDDVKAAVRELDTAAIAAAGRSDAEEWFRVIAEQDDATRICGYAPTYAMLRCAAPPPGRALGYAQSEEKDTSLVSVAAMAWN